MRRITSFLSVLISVLLLFGHANGRILFNIEYLTKGSLSRVKYNLIGRRHFGFQHALLL